MYDDIYKQMPEDVQNAIGMLEQAGFEIFCDTMIDDTRLKDGSRVRTFCKHGRYNLAICLKKADMVKPIDLNYTANQRDLQRQLKQAIETIDAVKTAHADQVGDIVREKEDIERQYTSLLEVVGRLSKIVKVPKEGERFLSDRLASAEKDLAGLKQELFDTLDWNIAVETAYHELEKAVSVSGKKSGKPDKDKKSGKS